ncbi:hypothetical protein J2T57_001608 [Natronocella acetinitrilica]|uniref:Uncharacterized protein n=1 Tax=Natronocella acetinitrilica TaxID=414046 RepID=A0AAE3G2D0_9GAMM|nr:hypothetical protein [Natronocella acetinitrilica]MCP1674506.1 hypothetical protein [Natronocella acetinitrilica]
MAGRQDRDHAAARERLKAEDAPRLVDAERLAGLLETATAPRVPRLSALLATLIRRGDLLPGDGRHCINAHARPAVRAEEVLAAHRPEAVVSLGRVLGEFGVLNNPSLVVSAIVPGTPSGERTRPGPEVRLELPVARVDLWTMPAALLAAGSPADSRIDDRPYACATPERALVDWLYLSGGETPAITPLPWDHDLEDLDHARLARLAEAVGVTGALEALIRRGSRRDLDDTEELRFGL